MLVFIMTILLSGCTHSPRAAPSPALINSFEPQPICKHYPLNLLTFRASYPNHQRASALLLSMDGALWAHSVDTDLPVWVPWAKEAVVEKVNNIPSAHSQPLWQQDPSTGSVGKQWSSQLSKQLEAHTLPSSQGEAQN